MTLSVAALTLALGSALAAFLLARDDLRAFRVATLGTLLACLVGLAGAARVLRSGAVRELRRAWPLPVGELHLGVDPLSAFFLACLCLVFGLALLHGLSSLPAAPAPAGGRRLARFAGLAALTVAAMIGVVLARDGVLFLVAWEAMTISSWLLVAHDQGRADARRAAMTYLIASHVGGVALYVLFALLAGHAGSYGFDAVVAAGPATPTLAGTAFGLALAGFGTKAAIFPLHVWAPDAYPAAPPPAAALLSGALSKMGIYGLARLLLLLGPPDGWWGMALVTVGAATAIAGALNAFAKRDLKRLVAYSSVENLGIVALGLGIGVLGRAAGLPVVAYLGFAGALLHVLNHGVMKALLLLLAGDVADATGTRALDRLGGLARTMPLTAGAFLVGAVAISGLPPLNGFVSEWLVLSAGLRGAASLPAGPAVFAVAAVAALALAGGLAAGAFVKAYGVAFLGAPRSDAPRAARDPSGTARQAVGIAVGLCLAFGLLPELAAALPAQAAGLLAGAPVAPGTGLGPLAAVTRVAWVLLLLVAALALVRLRLLSGREVRSGPVWGCGYEAPSPRMQYTATAFPDPALGLFGGLLSRTVEREGPEGYFPARARYEERRADAAGDRFVLPLYRRFLEALGRVRVLQGGRLQLYLLYVLVTLVVLLAWQLLLSP
ncbi:MAG TPA: proton-conducting transporter membrane subunit [Anaeromyxobacter sp.]|nr:proton-conducting transporter membrane subunit [Anaeromyxobacter sp.]